MKGVILHCCSMGTGEVPTTTPFSTGMTRTLMKRTQGVGAKPTDLWDASTASILHRLGDPSH